MINRLFTFLFAALLLAGGIAAHAQEESNRGNRRNRGNRENREATGNRNDTATSGTAVAPGSNAEPSDSPEGFDQFRIIVRRNIFDPNRASRRQQEETARQNATAETSNEPVTEYVGLIGIWIPDEKPFALISGNRIGSSQFGVGETFKDFRVVSITTSQVVLERDGKQLVWPTGQRIERKGEGEWQVAGPAEAQTRSAPGSTTSSSGSGGGSSDQSDQIKRMMERRKKGS
jgi:hypothetical protein